MLGRSSWSVNTKAASVKTDMATYRTQKVAGSWIADGVFSSHAVLRIFNAYPNCVRTMHDKPGSVFGVNRGQQQPDLIPASCRHALPNL